MKWLYDGEHVEFEREYQKAREAHADVLFDQCVDISDEDDSDVQRDRLRIDTRFKVASKLKPRKYGDKVDPGGAAEVRNDCEESLPMLARKVALAFRIMAMSGEPKL